MGRAAFPRGLALASGPCPAPKAAPLNTSESRHLAGLDLLRGLAIILVVLFHYPRPPGHDTYRMVANFGWTGVELFFVLSGFLIGAQFLEPMAKGETPSLPRFYLRRALRILPPFLVVLGLYLLVPAWSERPVVTPAWRFLTFTQNFGLHRNGFSRAWSLCVEEHFYLALPLTLLALRGRARAPYVLAGAVAVMVAGMLLRGGLWLHLFGKLGPDDMAWREYDTYLYYPTYARLDGLLCGVLLATVRVFRPALWQRWTHRPGVLLPAFGLLCLGGAAYVNQQYNRELSFAVLAFPLVSLGYAALLVSMAGPAASRVCARIPGVRTFAVLSFTVYLTHKSMQHLVRVTLEPHGMGTFHVVTLVGGAVAVLLASLLLHHAVERPALRWRERLERRLADRERREGPALL
ncbi:acyltransferase family protein [Corallococcus soli]|uniref:acyltransferase family protein n=1 Tax=Corallococcus soli TaxID=2710757 RepID=UPI0034E26D42